MIFALSITVLFAAAGLAFDVGRFYSERRFLQNAADAAALAAANSLIRGDTIAQADAEARDILDPQLPVRARAASRPSLPPVTRGLRRAATPATPSYLLNGILLPGRERTRPERPGRGPELARLHVRPGRRARPEHDRRPGPRRVDGERPADRRPPLHQRPRSDRPARPSPCDGNTSEFQDLVATADTACLGTETNRDPADRPDAGHGLRLAQPEQRPGPSRPDHPLIGQGAQSSNTSSFRGFVALDIRNFQSSVVERRSTTASRPGRTPTRWPTRGRLDRRRLPRPRLPAGHRAARSGRPGRDPRRQQVRDHHLRDRRPVRARRRGPVRRLLRHGHDDPGLHDERPDDGQRSGRPRTATAR